VPLQLEHPVQKQRAVPPRQGDGPAAAPCPSLAVSRLATLHAPLGEDASRLCLQPTSCQRAPIVRSTVRHRACAHPIVASSPASDPRTRRGPFAIGQSPFGAHRSIPRRRRFAVAGSSTPSGSAVGAAPPAVSDPPRFVSHPPAPSRLSAFAAFGEPPCGASHVSRLALAHGVRESPFGPLTGRPPGLRPFALALSARANRGESSTDTPCRACRPVPA
jgi:hypothetical protein